MAQVELRHVRCRYRVPRDLPEPRRVQAALDDLMSVQVPDRCGGLLASALPPTDEIVVVDRLDVHLALRSDVRSQRADVERLLAEAISTAVLAGLARADGARVARYDDWVDLVSTFVAAVARGAPIERWRFTPLVASTHRARWPAAARAVVERPAAVAGVLARLHRDGFLPIVAAHLDGADADHVLRVLADDLGDAPAVADDRLGTLAEQLPPRLGDPSAVALALCGAAAAAGWLTAATVPQASIVARHRSGRRPDRPIRSLDRDPAGTRSVEGADPGVAPPTSDPEVAELVPLAGSAETSVATAGEVIATPFGGLVLLLRALVDLELERFDPDPDVVAVLRWWLLISVLGRDRREDARLDRAVALFAGVPGPPTADLRRAATSALASDAGAALVAGAVTELRRVAPAAAGPTAGAADDLRANDPAHVASEDLLDPDVDADGRRLAARRLADLSLVALRRAARRVHGFEESSARHLADNVLVGWGRLEVARDGVTASVPDVALRVVLQMTGTLTGVELVPWLPGGRLLHGGDR